MIIPWLRGFLKFDQAPMTWALIAANIFIFMMTYDPQFKNMSQFFSDTKRFEMTANLYSQYKGNEGLPSERQRLVLGSQAMKDIQFIENAENIQFQGDDIAIAKWKKEIVEFREKLSMRTSSVFGFHFDHKQPLTFLTYQFMHAGFLHLFSNMLMLFLFAAALEQIAGSLITLGIYILGGVAGAYGFLILGESTLAPLVGASGSLSAIMAFYATIETKKRVQFFYFLSPIEGYYGWLWLPTWMIFLLSFVSDLASYLSTPSEIGSSVAYTAHLGGMTFGILMGFAHRKLHSQVVHFGHDI